MSEQNTFIFITDCCDSKRWYKDWIGYYFRLIETVQYSNGLIEHKTRTPEGYLNYVQDKDCIITVAGPTDLLDEEDKKFWEMMENYEDK